MATGTYEWQSDFARKYVGMGREEGRVEGEAKAVVAVLEARGVPVTDQVKARIQECTDLEQLDVWLHRAITAGTADDVFD